MCSYAGPGAFSEDIFWLWYVHDCCCNFQHFTGLSEAERTGPVRVELLTPPEKIQPEIAVEGVPVPVQPLPPLLQTAEAKAAEGVSITYGEDKVCVRTYRDPLALSLDGWTIPKDKSSWSVSTDAFEKFATGNPDSSTESVLYLAHKTCQEGMGTKLTVRLRTQESVRGGKWD